MRNDCYFKKDGGCTYPKHIRICLFCSCYLHNSGNIKEELKYYNFVENKKRYNRSLLISIVAIILSLIAILVDFREEFRYAMLTPRGQNTLDINIIDNGNNLKPTTYENMPSLTVCERSYNLTN